MNSNPRHRLSAIAVTVAALVTSTTACTFLAPGLSPPGTSIDQIRGAGRTPTGEYELPGGGRRLEFAQGSFGRETYMMDFDASGKLVKSEQVLDENHFGNIEPGMSSQDVRMRLGRPARVFTVGWQKLQVWNYRYVGGDCVWFQVSIGDGDGRVTETGTGYDPACDGPNMRD